MGVHPVDDGWETQDDVEDPQAWYDALRVGQANGGVIVADELGIYPDRMGRAAQRALGAKNFLKNRVDTMVT